MPYQIQASPKPTKIWLEDLDTPETPEQDRTYVTVRHADGNTRFLVEQVITGSEWVYDTEFMGETRTIVERSMTSPYMRNARLAWALIEECNILDEKDKAILTKDMAWSGFLDAWARLDPVHGAIMEAIYKANPSWGNPKGGNRN
jgi:hypothetical protein